MAELRPEALEAHRAALVGHCYRMLGSPVDADDAVQETMVRAWRSAETFDGRAALKTWLFRIATNVCLDLLADRSRRHRPIDERPAGKLGDDLETRPREHWLEPVPDARVVPADATPEEKLLLGESIRLAFVAALQHLPPKQRAALLLTEVLGWSAAEVAETLATSLAAVNSAIQRARATLATKDLDELGKRPLSTSDASIVDHYVAAFARYDLDALAALLHRDATMCMPPYTLWLSGTDDIRAWMSGPGAGCRGSRVVRVAASGQPAFAQWRVAPGGGYRAWAIVVLDVEGGAVRGVTSFLDTERMFPLFGLALELPDA